MDERVQARLAELRAEYAKGEQRLSELEAQVASVRATMLRISGAIQVLEELSAPGSGNGEREMNRLATETLVEVPATAD